MLWLFALFLWLSTGLSNVTILSMFFLLYTLFTLGDAMASVAWFDILGKSVPPSRRGRVLGSAQIIMGLLALGASRIAEWILSPTRHDIFGFVVPFAKLEFPMNYVLCFVIAGAGIMSSLICDLFITEVVQPVKEEPLKLSEYGPMLWRIIRHDAHFAYVTVVRLLAGLANMALPFYIIFAQRELHFAEEWLGTFIAAQVAGSLVSGTVLGFLSERSGSKAVILAAVFLQSIAPFTALSVFFIGNGLGTLAPWVYAIIFTMIGVGQTSNLLGFINYVLELAPPMERTHYIGVTNTINGLLFTAPVIGAALIQYVSYTGLFVATFSALLLSLLLATRMMEPRKQKQ
jgi:MFS family permease